MGRTKNELRFLDRYTRSKLVEWSVAQITTGEFIVGEGDMIFWEYAKSKGWIGKGGQIVDKGFSTAASFLK